MELKLKFVTVSLSGWVGGWTKTKLMQTSTQVEVVIEVGVALYKAVVEAGADLQYTLPDGLLGVEVIIMLSQLCI